jgi:protein-tyrosine-phosphatase
MSWRTRAALDSVGLAAPTHRSRQVGLDDVERADLVIGLAPEHVAWVRRQHPTCAARTGTLWRLATTLPAGPEPLASRIAALGLDAVELERWEEVVDPGGGDVEAFSACASDVVELVDALAARL